MGTTALSRSSFAAGGFGRHSFDVPRKNLTRRGHPQSFQLASALGKESFHARGAYHGENRTTTECIFINIFPHRPTLFALVVNYLRRPWEMNVEVRVLVGELIIQATAFVKPESRSVGNVNKLMKVLRAKATYENKIGAEGRR